MHVEGPPTLVSPPPAVVEGVCGAPLVVECGAGGRPQPEVVWAEEEEEEGELRPLLLTRGRRLGGGGGRLELEEEGVAGGLALVCMARSRRGEVRRRVQVSWQHGCNSTEEQEEVVEVEDASGESEVGEEAEEVVGGEVVEVRAGERAGVTLRCGSPGRGRALVQWTRGAELVTSWLAGFGLAMPRACGRRYNLFAASLGLSAGAPSCKVKQVPASKLAGMPGGPVGAASITLNWLGRGDEGRYTCAVWSLEGAGSLLAAAAVQLSVTGAPVVEEHSPAEVHAVQGAPLALHCRATGRPRPRVAWLREDSPISSPHPLFTIRESGQGSFLEVASATQVLPLTLPLTLPPTTPRAEGVRGVQLPGHQPGGERRGGDAGGEAGGDPGGPAPPAQVRPPLLPTRQVVATGATATLECQGLTKAGNLTTTWHKGNRRVEEVAFLRPRLVELPGALQIGELLVLP